MLELQTCTVINISIGSTHDTTPPQLALNKNLVSVDYISRIRAVVHKID